MLTNHIKEFSTPYLINRKNKQFTWTPSDTQENYVSAFKENMIMSQHTTYSEQDFNYTFNSHGFRCDEFESINAWPIGTPRILFSGCSVTEGIGLPVDHIWSTQLLSLLFPNDNIPYFSVAMGGDSIPGQVRKIIALIQSKIFKPDLVLINCPDIFRDEILCVDNKVDTTYFYLNRAPQYPQESLANLLFSTWDKRPIEFIRKYIQTQLFLLDLFLKSYGIPYFVVTWADNEQNTFLNHFYSSNDRSDHFLNTVYMPNQELCLMLKLDKFEQTIARDFLHFGPNAHYYFAKQIFDLKGTEIRSILNNK